MGRASYGVLFAASFAAIAIGVVIASQSAGVFFESNDDVGMMMLAHGFGSTDHASDLLLFSNRLQGWLISWIGMPFGQPGYSIYMYAVLAAALSFLVASLSKLNGSVLLSLAVVAAIGVRPILTPQFTAVAAVLTIAAVVAFLHYQCSRFLWLLVVATLLAFAGLLMRYEAACMVILLSSPFLATRAVLTVRVFLAGAALAMAVVIASIWNSAGYSGSAWDTYRSMEDLRVWFTDYQIGSEVSAQSDLLKSLGWSSNDLLMIELWWFFDPNVYSPDRLSEIVTYAVDMKKVIFDIEYMLSWSAIAADRYMLPTTVASTVFVLVQAARGHWRVFLSLLLCLLGFGFFAYMGHPGQPRVVYSALITLMVLSCTAPQGKVGEAILSIVALLSAGLSTVQLADLANGREPDRRALMERLSAVPEEDVVVVWGQALPYEQIYPALLKFGETYPSLRIYSLASDQLAPYALARWGGSGNGLVAKMRSADGVALIARGADLQLIDTYCSEHWGSHLTARRIVDFGDYGYFHVSCADARSLDLRPFSPPA